MCCFLIFFAWCSELDDPSRRRLLTFVTGTGLSYQSTSTDLRNYDLGVQDEGSNCRSSYAFASTAQFEINYNIFQGNDDPNCLVKFSEQYTIDCSPVGVCHDASPARGVFASNFYQNEGHCAESEYGAYIEAQRPSCQGCSDDYKAQSSDTKIVFPFNDYETAGKIVSDNNAMHFTINIRRGWFFLSRRFPFYIGRFGRVIGQKHLTIVGQRNRRRFFILRRLAGFLVKGSFGTSWGINGYAWIPASTLRFNSARYFTYSEFDSTTTVIPSPRCPIEGVCLAPCTTDPCSCDDSVNPHCRVCHTRPGCEQCQPGYFQLDLNYPCVNCQEAFGDGCTVCNNFFGCSQCSDPFTYQRVYDEECGMWKCEPRPECPRYRRAWHLLTQSERDLYIDGFLELFPQGITFDMNEVHRINSGPAHGGTGFLPWHRYFMWEV